MSSDSRAPLDIAWLCEQLVENGPYNRLEHTMATGSTNTDLVAAAHAGAPEWTAFLTEHQSQGRGRMGRKYESPVGAQLTLSVLIRPRKESVSRLGTMPLATGLALVDVLGFDPRIGLKWPNDLLCDGRKLCGILAEAVSLGDHPAVVIGLGLNTALTKEELPVAHATSLDLEGIAYERNQLAVDVLNALYKRLNQWIAGDPSLMGDYRRVCTSIGADVRVVLSEDKELLGVAESVTDEGLICVRDASGELHEFMVGDVTHLRLQDK